MRIAGLAGRTVTVLPDLYVDAICPVPPWRESSRRLGRIAARGGGNLPVGPIHVKPGGNAANTALALARLGATVRLIARTDHLGLHLLTQAAHGLPLDLSGVRIGPTSSATLALESPAANLMLSHSGPLADFGPAQITPADWDNLRASDAVALVNWSQNQRGTPLLAALARRLGDSGPFLFFDSGDPSHRGAHVRDLVAGQGWWRNVGAFGMNENELAWFAPAARAAEARDPDLMVERAQRLALRLGTRIDLHARTWAATVTGTTVVREPALATPARRLTGAGDAWNAGAIAGQLLGLSPRRRLRLAHKVATAYVTAAPSGPMPAAREASARRRPSVLSGGGA